MEAVKFEFLSIYFFLIFRGLIILVRLIEYHSRLAFNNVKY